MLRRLGPILFSLLFLTALVAPRGFAEDKTVALFPINIISPRPVPYLESGMKTMLASRLAEVGLKVITQDSFDEFMTGAEKKGKITKDRVQEIASKINAQYAIFGTLTAIGKGLSLDLSLLDLTKSPPKLTHVSEATTEDEFIPKLADLANRFRSIIAGIQPRTYATVAPPGQGTQSTPGLFRGLGQENVEAQTETRGIFISTPRQTPVSEPTGRAFVRMDLMAMDVADLDGDGNPEVALLSRTELRIYSRTGKTLRLLDTLKAPRGVDFIKVSMGDADGNGKPEIYVSRYMLNGIDTEVYEWNGRLKKLFKKAGHLVVVKSPGRKRPYLLYQNSHALHLFTGRIYIMGYAGHKLIKKITLPRLIRPRFYTLTPYDIDKDGSPEIIGLGDGDSLHVWNLNGEELWNENETIGGNNNAIDLQDKNPDPNLPRVPFFSRLVIDDIDGDGKNEVVAVKNIPIVAGLEHFRYFDSGYLLGYEMRGATLHRTWKTPKMPFCIVDIQSYKHTLFIGLQKYRAKNFGKGFSRIVWFDLPRKE